MVCGVSAAEGIIFFLGSEQRLHTFHFEFHLNIGRKLFHHFFHAVESLFLRIQRRTDGGEQMRIVKIDNMIFIQLQGTDEGLF